jgi:hypothetical protein
MKITYKEIAKAAGCSVSKVEGDKRKGLFDKEDLASVAGYIVLTLGTQAEASSDYDDEELEDTRPGLPGLPKAHGGKVPPVSAPAKVGTHSSFEWEA